MKVYFNNSCSICRFEINHYKKLPQGDIDWIDVTDNKVAESILNKSAKELIRRMHVMEDGKIFTLKHGYPQFYTQILIEKNKPEIFIKSVMNDIEGISKISTCKKIEKFDQQS